MAEFPFRCEYYILNNINLIKFTNILTNQYTLSEMNPYNYYLLYSNNTFYFIINIIEDYTFEYCLHIDEQNYYCEFINNRNEIKKRQLDNISPLLRIIPYLNSNLRPDNFNIDTINAINLIFSENMGVKFNYCIVNEIELDLTESKARIVELNVILSSCSDRYKLDFDYGYRMNNFVSYFSNQDTIIEQALSIILSLKIDNISVSTIDFEIKENKIVICTKTMPEYEGNKFNKLLLLVSMCIVQFFNVSYLEAEAYNSVSAYLIFKLFLNNQVDSRFNKYLTRRGFQIDTITFDNINKYIDKNDLITIKTPINQENIEHSYTQFIEVVKQLPCDKIVHQSGGYIINKTNKYRYKLNNNLNNKSNDIYFDKLLHWNTLYKIYKINKKLIK